MATNSSILALENPMDRGAQWATVQGSTKSRTRLSKQTTTTTKKVDPNRKMTTHPNVGIRCSQDYKCGGGDLKRAVFDDFYFP